MRANHFWLQFTLIFISEGVEREESSSLCWKMRLRLSFSFLGVALQQVMPGAQTLPPQSASVLQGWPQLHRQVRNPVATSGAETTG